MKKRVVGILIIGIALLIGFITLLFNRALTKIVNTACEHGPTCPMWGTIDFQTYVSIGIMLFVVVVGLYLIFFGKEEQTEKIAAAPQVKAKAITKEAYKQVLGKLHTDEAKALEGIIDAKGTIFQSELVEKTGFNKVKITRILDRLEGRGIIERKRRGMSNVIILKH